MSAAPRQSILVPNLRTRYPLSSIDQGERVLQVVGSLRFATAIQLRRAIFDPVSGSPRQARTRATRSLRRLFDSGYLRRVQVFCPSASSDRLSLQVVNVLSSSGAPAVGLEPRVARARAPKARSVLSHEFWLVECGVLAFEGCPAGLSITRWWGDRVLAARHHKGLLSLPTIPDALLVVRHEATGKEFPAYIELDLGTEVVRARGAARADLAGKIDGYLAFDRARFYQEFGINAGPIVLFVTDSDQRADSVRDLTRRLGGAGRFWFVTLPRLRGTAPAPPPANAPFDALHGPFWAQTWLTAANEQPRSLAARCGL